MTEQKTIAIIGATGAQGGGLARAILDDPEGRYTCRALTRNPASEAARALADRGAHLLRADLDNEDSLTKAFQAAHGAYCMTNFFEHFSPEKELQQAANLARRRSRPASGMPSGRQVRTAATGFDFTTGCPSCRAGAGCRTGTAKPRRISSSPTAAL